MPSFRPPLSTRRRGSLASRSRRSRPVKSRRRNRESPGALPGHLLEAEDCFFGTTRPAGQRPHLAAWSELPGSSADPRSRAPPRYDEHHVLRTDTDGAQSRASGP